MVGGSLVAGTDGVFDGGGWAPSPLPMPSHLPMFPGLAFHGSGPDQDAPGGKIHPAGGGGEGPSFGSGGPHSVYFDPAPSSSSRPRRSSFDKLAEMIPGIPHWMTPSSPLASSPPSTGTAVEAGELHGAGGGGGSGSSSTKPKEVRVPGGRIGTGSRTPTASAWGRQQQPASTHHKHSTKRARLLSVDDRPEVSTHASVHSRSCKLGFKGFMNDRIDFPTRVFSSFELKL